MPDDGEQHSPWVRARQRDPNSGMIGFVAALSPRLNDVGVDRFQITVTGRWQSTQSNGRSLFENAFYLPQVDWFNRPQRTPSGRNASRFVSLSKRQNTSTINACDIAVRRINTSEGLVQLDLTLNPTRTLAHLLIRASQLSDIRPEWSGLLSDVLQRLPVVEFFARADGDLLRALDGSDNVLPPTRQVRERLGDDFWTSYLAIFAAKVRHFCIHLLSEFPNVQTEGAVDRISLPDGEVVVDWAEIRVPQIECYFERFHRDAIMAVRRGGWAVLAADHSSEMRMYADRATFSRDNARFAVGLPLDDAHKLAIYAKLPDRVRFEVRRMGKGNYTDLPPPISPTSRLTDILNHEREQVLGTIRWPSIGELFAGPDRPQLHDLEHLLEQLRWAAEGDADLLATLFKSLLIEGGLSDDGVPARAIQHLVQQRVIARVRIRRRDINNRTRRYALTAPYRDVHVLLSDPLRAINS